MGVSPEQRVTKLPVPLSFEPDITATTAPHASGEILCSLAGSIHCTRCREIHASLVLHSHRFKAAEWYSRRRTQHPSTMIPNVELLLGGRSQPKALLRAILLSVTSKPAI